MGKGRLLVISLLVAVAVSVVTGSRRRVQHWTPEGEVDELRERMERARAALLQR